MHDQVIYTRWSIKSDTLFSFNSSRVSWSILKKQTTAVLTHVWGGPRSPCMCNFTVPLLLYVCMYVQSKSNKTKDIFR